MNHKEIVIEFKDEAEKETIITALFEIGYDGFAEEDNLLKAYIEEDRFIADSLNEATQKLFALPI